MRTCAAPPCRCVLELILYLHACALLATSAHRETTAFAGAHAATLQMNLPSQAADTTAPLQSSLLNPQSVPQLLRSADLACDAHVAGASKEFVAQLFAYTWEPLVAALKKEPDADIQAA